MKYCLSCMTKIPLMASRCPNCIKEGQGVWGRLLLVVVIGAAFLFWVFGIHGTETSDVRNDTVIQQVDDTSVAPKESDEEKLLRLIKELD